MVRVVNVELRQGYTRPGYAELRSYADRNVVILGNSIQSLKDGTECIWTADWLTGHRIDAAVAELKYPLSKYGNRLRKQPRLVEVAGRVMDWAAAGNGDAMWWLGHFFEFGSREIPADGGRALAYYLGAIRCEPKAYDKATVDRVLNDGATLFRADHPPEVGDVTTDDVSGFLKQFKEYKDVMKGVVYYPDTKSNDWEECISIANKAAETSLNHLYWQ